MDTSCNRAQDRAMISYRSGYRELKSVQNGGDAMTNTTTRAKGISRSRALTFSAMLMGALLTILLLPAYGQQEVDPTWYNPWVAPSAAVVPAQLPAVVHSTHSPVAAHGYQQTAKPLSATSSAATERAHGTQLDQRRRVVQVAVDSKKRMALSN